MKKLNVGFVLLVTSLIFLLAACQPSPNEAQPGDRSRPKLKQRAADSVDAVNLMERLERDNIQGDSTMVDSLSR